MSESQSARAWQREAFESWKQSGYRAIVEAATGTGKTLVGSAAVMDSVKRGRQAMVVVPGVELLEQWYVEMTNLSSGMRIGRRGNGHTDNYRHCDVLITTIQSATGRGAPMPRQGALLVADDVHRYGTPKYATVLSGKFDERLGLTTRLERDDPGVDAHLVPFFQTVLQACDFQRAKADEIVAPVRLMTLAVPFTDSEERKFAVVDTEVKTLQQYLISDCGCTAEPFEQFIGDVVVLGKDRGRPGRVEASKYLAAFGKRHGLLANCEGKSGALTAIAAGLGASGRSIVFTADSKESAAKGADALNGGGLVAQAYSTDLDKIGRTRTLAQLRKGEVSALVVPKILDEGIDVPAVDVGVLVAGSTSRRQIIQRMGRVLRAKPVDRAAVFVVLYVTGTIEDPKLGVQQVFLDELTAIADERLDVSLEDAGDVLARWSSQSVGIPEPAKVPARQDVMILEPIFIPEPADVVPPVDVLPVKKTLTAREALSRASSGSQLVRDGLLRCMGTLNSKEAAVLIRRFGLDGAPPRDVATVAKETGTPKSMVGDLETSGLRALEREASDVLQQLSQ